MSQAATCFGYCTFVIMRYIIFSYCLGTMTSQMTEIVIKSNVGKHISGRSLLEEASIIDMLRHDNIVKLIDVVRHHELMS